MASANPDIRLNDLWIFPKEIRRHTLKNPHNHDLVCRIIRLNNYDPTVQIVFDGAKFREIGAIIAIHYFMFQSDCYRLYERAGLLQYHRRYLDDCNQCHRL